MVMRQLARKRLREPDRRSAGERMEHRLRGSGSEGTSFRRDILGCVIGRLLAGWLGRRDKFPERSMVWFALSAGGTLSACVDSFRLTRPTAVRIVLRAWSLATGLVRISSAPRRKAVGRPARPSTMAMGTGCCRPFRVTANVKDQLGGRQIFAIDQHQIEASAN